MDHVCCCIPVADQQARSRLHRASLLHSTHAQGMSPSLRMTSRERAAAERVRRGWRTQRVVELRLGKGLQLRGGAGVRQATVHVQQRGERRRQRRAHREPGRRVRLPEQAGCARAGQAGLSSACTASPAAPPPAGDAAPRGRRSRAGSARSMQPARSMPDAGSVQAGGRTGCWERAALPRPSTFRSSL